MQTRQERTPIEQLPNKECRFIASVKCIIGTRTTRCPERHGLEVGWKFTYQASGDVDANGAPVLAEVQVECREGIQTDPPRVIV